MFQPYTEEASRLVARARDEARCLGYDYAGSEHILLGLLSVKKGLAGQVLKDLGIDIDGVRRQIPEVAACRDADSRRPLPFTTPARMALKQAQRESLLRGQRLIGTEHLLLGLLSLSDCRGARILQGMGVGYETARDEVVLRSSGLLGDRGEVPVTGGPLRVSSARDPYGAVLERLASRDDPAPDMLSVRVLKERTLAERRFFAITYRDECGGQRLVIAASERQEDGFWFPTASSGGPRPAPRREGRWIYLEGWYDEDHLCLGGELLVDNGEASEVRLLLEDGTELVDDLANGVVLFVAERRHGRPVGVHVYNSVGALLASHPVH